MDDANGGTQITQEVDENNIQTDQIAGKRAGHRFDFFLDEKYFYGQITRRHTRITGVLTANGDRSNTIY